MKIGIDLRAIGQGKYSGVEEYTLNLLDALFAVDRKNQYLLFSSGQSISDRYLEFSRKAKEKNSNINLCHCSLPNRILNSSFKILSWPKIDKLIGQSNVIFEPNINLLPSRGTKKVVTFHDLSFEKYNGFFSAKQIFWHNFVNPKKIARDADLIIAVSESTKNDLVEIYGIPEKKIKVIYSGVNHESRITNHESRIIQEIKIKYSLPEKYILYLGTIEPRKNIIGIIKAFELYKKSHLLSAISHKLVVAGSKGWLYNDVFSVVRNSLWKEDIIFTGFVADGDKAYLYNLASLFVYPSFYEGFGFPPLEAMINGVPVITSDCSSFPEVAGNAAIMINPYNSGQLAWAIGEVLENQELREKMVARGYEQVKKFSWKKCAMEVLGVFESMNNE